MSGESIGNKRGDGDRLTVFPAGMENAASDDDQKGLQTGAVIERTQGREVVVAERFKDRSRQSVHIGSPMGSVRSRAELFDRLNDDRGVLINETLPGEWVPRNARFDKLCGV